MGGRGSHSGSCMVQAIGNETGDEEDTFHVPLRTIKCPTRTYRTRDTKNMHYDCERHVVTVRGTHDNHATAVDITEQARTLD